MPVLAEIVASPVLAAIAVAVGVHTEAVKPPDPCRPPVFRFESANLAALPGPNSLACKEALKAREIEKAQERKP
jgi:hypothetical protein